MPAPVANRRDEILSIAANLFSRHGYQQTSMQQIADEVGILKGSLYHHYKSKQEILFEISRRPLVELLEGVRAVAAENLPAAEKVRKAIFNHVTAMTGAYPHLMVVTAETDESLPAGIREEILTLRREYQRVWESIMNQGLRDGTMSSRGPAAVVVNFVLGSVNWMHRWYAPSGQLDPNQLAMILSDMVLDGVRTRASSRQN